MTIGQAIKHYRRERLMTQEDLAKAMGYRNRSSITKIEKDINCPPLSTLRKFAEVLDVDVWEIIGFNSVVMDDVPEEKKAAPAGGLDEELVEMLLSLTPDQVQRVRDFVAGMKAADKA